MLRQMVGIGSGGIFEHYLAGDASTGNLATATAMELPMQKLFEYSQELWRDVFSDIFWFVLVQAILAKAPQARGLATVTVNTALGIWDIVPNEGVDISAGVRFPAIVQKDVGVWLSSIAQVLGTQATTGQAYIPQLEAITLI